MLNIFKDKISKRRKEIKTNEEEALKRIEWKLTNRKMIEHKKSKIKWIFESNSSY